MPSPGNHLQIHCGIRNGRSPTSTADRLRRKLSSEIARRVARDLNGHFRSASAFDARERAALVRTVTHNLQGLAVAGYRLALVEARFALMAEGMPACQASKMLGHPNPTLHKWADAYRRYGVAGLVPKGHALSSPSQSAKAPLRQTAEHCGASPMDAADPDFEEA